MPFIISDSSRRTKSLLFNQNERGFSFDKDDKVY